MNSIYIVMTESIQGKPIQVRAYTNEHDATTYADARFIETSNPYWVENVEVMA